MQRALERHDANLGDLLKSKGKLGQKLDTRKFPKKYRLTCAGTKQFGPVGVQRYRDPILIVLRGAWLRRRFRASRGPGDKFRIPLAPLDLQ
jgi:hypothetical protein